MKVLAEAAAAIRALPDMSVWLQQVITEAARRELFGQEPSRSPKHPSGEVLVLLDRLEQTRLGPAGDCGGYPAAVDGGFV